MSETEIRGQIVKYLQRVPRCRFRVQQKHSRNRHNFTEPGWPDISGYLATKGLFIEVKTEDGVVSLEQERFIREAKQMGHVALIARSVDDVHREVCKHVNVLK